MEQFKEERPSSDKLKTRFKALVFAVISGCVVYAAEIQDAIAEFIKSECISGTCVNGYGVKRIQMGNGDILIARTWSNRDGYSDECHLDLDKNGHPLYNGPSHDGWYDTQKSRSPETGEICTNLGTKYYDDHTDESPHKDVGEWKDGKKHGNVARYNNGVVRYGKYRNDEFLGRWSGDGFHQGHFITVEEIRQNAREQETKAKQRSDDILERATRNSPVSVSQTKNYDWIDTNTGKYKCSDIALDHKTDFCKEGSELWYGMQRCKVQVDNVCR
jgi:hypothetical protein